MRTTVLASVILLGLSAAWGCSSNEDASVGSDDDAARATLSSAQRIGFDALVRATGETWAVRAHDEHKTPMHLASARTGKRVLAPGADVVATTHSILTEAKSLFRMRDPRAELQLERADADALGMTHARFQQMTHGIPVVGAELAAHYDREGHLASIQANYVADLEGLDLTPTISAPAARAAATADFVQAMPEIDASEVMARATMDEGRLVVFALGGHAPRLAYEHRLRAVFGAHPAIWVTTIDARTGAILDRYDNLQTITGSSPGVLGDAKTFEVTASGTGYVMVDSSGGSPIRTYTAATQEVTPGSAVGSTLLTRWDTGVTGAGAAVDAHAYAAVVHKYYKERHQRNAIDGLGGAMESTVHFGVAYDNAFWDGSGMSYGDGGQVFRPLSAGLDVVAHEFSHGVTERTSNLRYQNQSGALNEAFSDIISAYVEHYAKPDATKNWLLGENVSRQGGPLRDMKTPANGDQPAAMNQYRNTTQDNGGVHINSGIINNAAFLMTMGGVNPATKIAVKYGIGWEKAEKLWYRANTKYFLATTNFAQAALATKEAAKDVALTANEIAIVDCAWKAVGIGTGACATLVDPQSSAPSPTAGDAGADASGTDGEEDLGGDEGDIGDDEAPTTTTKTKKKRTVAMPSSGCNAGAGGAGAGDIEALVGLVIAFGVVGRRRAKVGRNDGRATVRHDRHSK